MRHPHDKYDLSGPTAAAARMSAMEADAIASGLLDVRPLQHPCNTTELMHASNMSPDPTPLLRWWYGSRLLADHICSLVPSV